MLELLFLFYAFACYGHFRSLMQSLFVSPSFPALGVHLITIEKMFDNDVTTFLIFLFLYMINYFTSMFITFPVNHEDQDANADAEGDEGLGFGALAPFDNAVPALGAIYNMAVFGQRFATMLDEPTLRRLSGLQALNFAVFFFHHSMFAIMCTILLVRLLMAMMTNTFQGVKKSALLEWRLMIARAVLRHELLFFFAPSSQKLAGERGVDGKYYHSFLHVKPDPDGQVHVPLLLAQKASSSLFDEDEAELPHSEEAHSDEAHELGAGASASGDSLLGAGGDPQAAERERAEAALFGRSTMVTPTPLIAADRVQHLHHRSHPASSKGSEHMLRRSTTNLFSRLLSPFSEGESADNGIPRSYASNTEDGGGGSNSSSSLPDQHAGQRSRVAVDVDDEQERVELEQGSHK